MGELSEIARKLAEQAARWDRDPLGLMDSSSWPDSMAEFGRAAAAPRNLREAAALDRALQARSSGASCAGAFEAAMEALSFAVYSKYLAVKNRAAAQLLTGYGSIAAQAERVLAALEDAKPEVEFLDAISGRS